MGSSCSATRRYLDVAESVCRWILALPRERTDSGTCLSYHALEQNSIHNANMLGAALLARTWRHSKKRRISRSGVGRRCSTAARGSVRTAPGGTAKSRSITGSTTSTPATTSTA